MLGVHEGHLAAHFLGLRQNVQSQRGLTGGLRPVDLDDAAPGHAADAQRQIQRQRAGGDGLHIGLHIVAIAHDRALAVGFFDLLHGGLQRLFLVGDHGSSYRAVFLRCHVSSSCINENFRGKWAEAHRFTKSFRRSSGVGIDLPIAQARHHTGDARRIRQDLQLTEALASHETQDVVGLPDAHLEGQAARRCAARPASGGRRCGRSRSPSVPPSSARWGS